MTVRSGHVAAAGPACDVLAGCTRTQMVERAMTLLTHHAEGPSIPYAGQPMHILAGHDSQPPGFAAMEITVPGRFAGPIPHAHDEFDEAIYVLSGRLLVIGDGEPQEAVPGSMFVAPRGHRHGFSNPSGEQARVLGLWAPPAGPGLHAGHRCRADARHPARPGPHARNLHPARQPTPALTRQVPRADLSGRPETPHTRHERTARWVGIIASAEPPPRHSFSCRRFFRWQ